ncbi:short chain dehydrogenase [compost metagenome]
MRLNASKLGTMSIACHPGIAATNITSRGSGREMKFLTTLMNTLFQTAAMGALPILYAGTESSLVGGEYIGPDGRGAKKGYPALDPTVHKLFDKSVSERLWHVSEELTGVRYIF